ncbi:chromatin accessibility complex protein 1-like protein [Leptotrombidium deliense]|uniref:Chromatin accessibility complex protein 1-like protein n=1 Tax=Leptotrombidium deliense TaxID=299467 RepID=A0A443SRW8_9ACAR|nr:chromatin accessibility complex protein 1-like protein [Leptotrombidium deliense]
MRSSPNVNNVSEDAVVITAKAAELFLAHLAVNAHDRKNDHNLEYNDIAEIVEQNSEFSFLHDIIPKKITVREYRKMLAEFQNEDTTEKCNRKREASSEEEN